ncbi:hypothetical protein [Okeania sp. KiyG1]|uniref:hypothetical protein n=1 Tax=Okeania sp. KiyG1 TaxID=2720165 RepID=UPI001921BAFE|nr:hypothetical protein [Okeania sp. KiyG1]
MKRGGLQNSSGKRRTSKLFWKRGTSKLFWKRGTSKLFWKRGTSKLFWKKGELQNSSEKKGETSKSPFLRGI